MLETFNKYDGASIVLYILIILFSTLFAYGSQTKFLYEPQDQSVYRKHQRAMFVVSFIILATFVCFSGVGIDKTNYKYLFHVNEFNYIYPGVEVGFWLFICVFKLISHNELLFLGAIAFLTILFTYKGIWACKDKISVGFAVFIFSSQYYLQSMNLVRMYFAMSILILGAHLLFTDRYKSYIWYILIACSVHYSLLFVLVAFVFFLILTSLDFQSSKFLFLISALLAAVVSFSTMDMVSWLLNTQGEKLGKYLMYLSQAADSYIGFKWILNLIPFFVIYMLSRKLRLNKRILYLAMSYGVVLFVISIMGYYIPVFARATITFHMPVVICLPFVIEEYRKKFAQRMCSHNCISVGMLNKIKVLDVFMIVYFMLLLLLYLRDYPILDGIGTYKFIWS